MSSTKVLDRVLGAVLFVAVIGAWVYCKAHGIETTELMAFAVPVIGALFLVGPITKGAEAATQAATQTNGMMTERVKAAVAAALADRDAARTRQAKGDISEEGQTPTAWPPSTSDAASTQLPDYQPVS